MWDKLVELVVGKSLDRLLEKRTAREKLARAFVQLHTELTACHKAFLVYAASNEDERHKDEWGSALVRLSRSIEQLGTLLDLHASDLQFALQGYQHEETVAYIDTPSNYKEVESDGDSTLGIAATINRQLEVRGEDEHDFTTVMTHLKRFMAEDLKLKPEEIIDAQ